MENAFPYALSGAMNIAMGDLGDLGNANWDADVDERVLNLFLNEHGAPTTVERVAFGEPQPIGGDAHFFYLPVAVTTLMNVQDFGVGGRLPFNYPLVSIQLLNANGGARSGTLHIQQGAYSSETHAADGVFDLASLADLCNEAGANFVNAQVDYRGVFLAPLQMLGLDTVPDGCRIDTMTVRRDENDDAAFQVRCTHLNAVICREEIVTKLM